MGGIIWKLVLQGLSGRARFQNNMVGKGKGRPTLRTILLISYTTNVSSWENLSILQTSREQPKWDKGHGANVPYFPRCKKSQDPTNKMSILCNYSGGCVCNISRNTPTTRSVWAVFWSPQPKYSFFSNLRPKCHICAKNINKVNTFSVHYWWYWTISQPEKFCWGILFSFVFVVTASHCQRQPRTAHPSPSQNTRGILNIK